MKLDIGIEDLSAIGKRYRDRQTHRKSERGQRVSATENVERLQTRLALRGYSKIESEALVSLGRTGGAQAEVTLERIIQENDLTAIQFFIRGLSMARAVCRIVIRDSSGRVRGYGTGFRIGRGLVMTNNHVLASADEAINSVAQFDYFGLNGFDRFPMAECELAPRRFFSTDKTLDYSVVAFDEREDRVSRAWFPLIRASGKALKGEAVNILQHPGGEPLQIAFRNNQVVDVLDDFLHYGTDTLPGSSGSPVTNDAWDLAALHHSGVPATDASGAILKTDNTLFKRGDDPSLIRWVANEGVRISRIVAHLDRLGLGGSEGDLYQSCFIPPDVALLFSALGQETANERGSPAPFTSRVGADGIARWQFELTFGPAGDAALSSVASTPSPIVRSAPVIATNKLRNGFDAKPSTIKEAARRIADRGRRTAYFDMEGNVKAVRDYYKGISSLQGRALFTALRKQIAATHDPVSSYTKARIEHLYPVVDRYDDGKLRSVYSGKIMDAEAVIEEELANIARVAPEIVEQLAAGESENEDYARAEEKLEQLEADMGFNCEHVVPQSWFDKAEPMRSDLHHLFTCESNCNSYRGNTPYFDFDDYDPEPSPDEAAVRALCGKRDAIEGGKGFEPEFGKGAVARATLYFILRYPDEARSAPVEFGGEFLQLLMDWHEAFPVSEWEKHRNEVIAEVQGNRNPFIDKPSWVRAAFA